MNIKNSIAFTALLAVFASASTMAQTGEKLKATVNQEGAKTQKKIEKAEGKVEQTKTTEQAKVNTQVAKSKSKIEEVKTKETAKVDAKVSDMKKETAKAEDKVNQMKKKSVICNIQLTLLNRCTQ